MSSRPAAARKPSPLLRSTAYRVFYFLPKRVRRQLVRVFTPTYTVGAVMLLYSNDGERLLMLRQPPGKGWGLPAGLLERAERPKTAAARELHEETGIRLGPDDIAPASPCAVVHTQGQWVDTVFTARVDPEECQLAVDGAEVWDARWWPVEEMPETTPAAARLLAHYGLGPFADLPEAARAD
ncbi:MAG: NUDIX domain-containing protein [Stackebrandtia sp.]